jgi:small subunit ribosomal protein S9
MERNLKINSTGKRKEAIAQVFLTEGKGNIIINEKPYNQNFLSLINERELIKLPLVLLKLENNYDIKIKVYGGGLLGQIFAIKLALAKSLAKIKDEYRLFLNKHLLLRSDARIKERRKYGLKKARKAPQYSKR